MKKFCFIASAITLSLITILAVVSFVIVFVGLTFDTFESINLTILTLFDVLFWVTGHSLAPVVRECYYDWKEEYNY